VQRLTHKVAKHLLKPDPALRARASDAMLTRRKPAT